MKKYLAIIAFISLAALSCKKDQKENRGEDTVGKLYPVTFSVNVFTQQHEPVINSTSPRLLADVPLKGRINHLMYSIYKLDGTRVKSRSDRRFADATFGTFKDSLAAGEYILTVLGSDQSSTNYQLNNGNVYTVSTRYSKPMECRLFSKKINLTVSPNGNNSQTITLERVNAALEIVVKDKVPYNSTINVGYVDYHGFGMFNNETGKYWDDNDPPEYQVNRHSHHLPLPGGVSNPSVLITDDVLNTSTPIDIGISVTDNNKNVIAQKTVYGVRFYRNTKTILTGRLFSNDPSGTGNAGFQTTFKTAFEADSIVKNF